MTEILNKISQIITKYDGGEWESLENLRILLRELSSNYYYLTKHNIEYAQAWNMQVYNFKGSNAAAQTFADLKVPELRITRKILMAADRVINSIRSEISIIKIES